MQSEIETNRNFPETKRNQKETKPTETKENQMEKNDIKFKRYLSIIAQNILYSVYFEVTDQS